MWESLGALFNLNVVDFEPFFFLVYFCFLFFCFLGLFLLLLLLLLFLGVFSGCLFLLLFFFPLKSTRKFFQTFHACKKKETHGYEARKWLLIF